MSSLFQAREWWRTRLGGAGEEFCHGSLAVANVDNAADGGCKVITGSLQGMLRLYSPRQRGSESDGSRGDSSQDLLLEQPLDHPILQLEVGKFMMHGEQLAVAVLHPRRLVVYSIELKIMSGEAVHTAEVLYRHDLTANNSGESFTAYNMCCGTFGGSERDSVR